jgi:transposase
MWEGYVTAVQETLPDATIVVDRFHVARHYQDGVDTLRTQEVRRLRAALPADQQDDLKHLIWLIRAHPDNRDATDQENLERFLMHSPAMRQALTLRDELMDIFDTARSKADRLRRIGYWRQRVVKSGLTCFDRFPTLLDTWQDLIANYFTQHQTSGFVEGLNPTLKVLTRRCYGVRNVSRLFQRLTLDLDGYRRFNPWHATTH